MDLRAVLDTPKTPVHHPLTDTGAGLEQAPPGGAGTDERGRALLVARRALRDEVAVQVRPELAVYLRLRVAEKELRQASVVRRLGTVLAIGFAGVEVDLEAVVMEHLLGRRDVVARHQRVVERELSRRHLQNSGHRWAIVPRAANSSPRRVPAPALEPGLR